MSTTRTFKTLQAKNLYLKVYGECFDILYKYSDAMYSERDITPIIKSLYKKLGSKANIIKVIDKLKHIFKDADYAYDLPEHPEKHNGYRDSHKYTEPVMGAFGFKFTNAKMPDITTNMS